MASSAPVVNGDLSGDAQSTPVRCLVTPEETIEQMKLLIKENTDLKETLQQTNSSMKEKFEELSVWKERQTGVIEFLERKLEEAKEHISTLTRENVELQRLKKSDGGTQVRMEARRREVDTLNTVQVEKLSRELQQVRSDLEIAESINKTLTDSCRVMEQEKLQQGKQKQEKQLQEKLQQALQEKQKQEKQLQEKLQQALQEKLQQEKQLQELQEKQKQEKQLQEKLQQALQEKQKQENQLQEKLQQALQEKLQQEKQLQELQEKQKQEKQLQEKLQQALQQQELQSQRVEELQKSLAQLQEAYTQLSDENCRMKEEVKRGEISKEAVNALQTRLEAAEKALADKQVKMDGMKQEIFRKEKELETIPVFQTQAEVYLLDFNAERAAREKIHEEKEHLCYELEALKQQNRCLQEELDGLARQSVTAIQGRHRPLQGPALRVALQRTTSRGPEMW
ncbi:hypothetical protein ANANG_G00314990 [Anguilla anguilla]|uniref:Optineurin n=1 Tax=Anguilla anguilla TaxID=7936 RepID=A0A9D3LIT0_ANGAN|nr:hypothetical protein ANANG_G00314990 [Anguilla anguilla]